MLSNVQTSLERRVALESGAANAASSRDLQTSAEPPLRGSLSRRGLVFLVRASRDGLQHVIRQRPLQRLRLIHSARIQTSRSSSVVRITGIVLG
jgi:hypothetical protein